MSFRRFFLVRLGWTALGLWLAVTLAFVAAILPKPPRVLILCGGPGCNPPGDYDETHTVPQRYWHFLSLLVRDGSAGVSLISGEDTGRTARAALPVTASVVAVALGLAIAAALLLALIRAPFARLPGYVAAGSFATFLFALWVAHYLFGFKLGRAPPSGYCDLIHAHSDCGGARDWLSHLIVPAALLALFPAVVYARLVREGRSLIRKSKEPECAGRRVALPLARVVGRDFGFLIGAAVFVEAAFSLPGLGQMLATGTAAYDRPAVGAALVYATVLALAVHFLVDLIVGALDSDLRGGWPFAAMPSPLRLATVPAGREPVDRSQRFRLRRGPASKRGRLSGADG